MSLGEHGDKHADTTTTTTTTSIEDENVRDVYERIGKHFDATRSYQWSWIERFRANYSSTHTLYDIGCGNGRNMGENTIGVDTCDVFLELCRAKQLSVVKADMTHLPFGDTTADGILSIASFHHLSTVKRRHDALREMCRVLKNEAHAKILLSVWSARQPKKTRRTFEYGDVLVPWTGNDGAKHMRYYYIFTIPEITQLFQDAGLEIVEHTWECGNEVFILQKMDVSVSTSTSTYNK